jgi:diguanylate cyclase (GGDEF)-like protein
MPGSSNIPVVADDSSASVLLVDDDPTIRLLVSRYLQSTGLKVQTASNGREGVEMFSRLHPDVVLLDVMMPELDGFAACRAMRRARPGLLPPILMMTGLDDPDSIEGAYDAGATDFISKPIENVLLAHRVRYLLRNAGVMKSLRASESHLARAQEVARLGHWIWSPGKGSFQISDSLRCMLDMPPGTTGLRDTLRRFLRRLRAEDRARLLESLRNAVHDQTSWQFRHGIQQPDQPNFTLFHQANFGPQDETENFSITGIVQDVTEAEQAESRIRYLAYHDSLTGLPNRESFRSSLEQAIDLARRPGRQLAVMFLDLDNFKRINDTLSHRAGDLLLEVVAERLVSELRQCDRVSRSEANGSPSHIARLGGDEFTILLSDVRTAEDAAIVARRLLEAILAPAMIEEHEVCTTASIGIAVFPGDGADADRLLRNADTAMNSAKREGKNTSRFYSESMNIRAWERLSMEMNLRKAMEKGQLSLNYQPLVDLAKGRVVAFEALLRWKHPELGSIPPQDFIPLAENSGLIVILGEWVLKQVCAQQKRERDGGHPRHPVAVNVSSVQFRQPNFVSRLREILLEYKLDGSALELEVTESILMENRDDTQKKLKQLKALGVRLSIDDFGTGYSSLSYLKSYPFDTLKIDRSFVTDLPDDTDSAAIAGGIIAIGHGLGMRVLAEGIESQPQLDFLAAHGCDLGQGYLLGYPLPMEEALADISRNVAPPTRAPGVEEGAPEPADDPPTQAFA